MGLAEGAWWEANRREMMKTILLLMMGVVAGLGQEAKPPGLLAKGEDGRSVPLGVDAVEVQVSVVRKEIDPGLLEWTKGNNFRTRIYPIPAKGFKSVRVGYEEELAEEDGKYVYRLPLGFGEKVGSFKMRVEVERTEMAANELEVEGMAVERRKARTVVLEAAQKNFAADEPIVLRMVPEEGLSVVVEEWEGEQYFYVVDREGNLFVFQDRPAVMEEEGGDDPFADGGGGGVTLYAVHGREHNEDGAEGAGIELAKWDPKTPYLKALGKVKEGGDVESVYFGQKEKHGKGSAFYLDVADFLIARKEEKLALRVLTNVAEMDLESVPLLRILGHRLDQLGELELAEEVFREAKDLREEEPQSLRDLALVLEKRGQFQEALDLQWSVVKFEWDDRFPEIQMIALMEMNALVARQKEGLDVSAIDARFLRNLDCDVRIVLIWDADDTDMDLWVTGSGGERCYYAEPATSSGGRMSEDFTGGYGPEEFLIRRALPGGYRVQVNYYGNRQQVLAGATTVQAVLITNWGRPNEKREAVTLRLQDAEDVVKVGELLFGE